MRNGFSLVELSIVLVILGLLAGGILAGQSLIRASELRSSVADFQRYQAAVYGFRDKYRHLPGDINNATAFWGSAGGTGADAACFAAQTAALSATCNGNGNGDSTVYHASALVANSERFTAWKHLANAGLIEGNYTGKTNDADITVYDAVPDVNTPRSKLGNNGWWDIMTPMATSGFHDVGTLYIRMVDDDFALLKAEEAWNIDIKLDDGKPGYGSARSNPNTQAPDCTTTDDAATSLYDLTKTMKGCKLSLKAN